MSAFTELPQEKGNRRIAAVLAVGLHVAVGVLLFFLAAWKAPDPPIPDYGIELNFGLVDAGSGDVQPEPQSSETAPVEETTETEQPEEKVTESEPEPEPVVSPVESPVVVKKPKPEVKKPEPKKPVEEKKPEPVKKPEPEKPKQVVNQEALFNADRLKLSQGNTANTNGDQGSKDGSLKGNDSAGGLGGGGTSYSTPGWKMDNPPYLTPPPDEKNGTHVFELIIDEDGYVEVRTKVRALSPAFEKLYKEELRKQRLTPLGANTNRETVIGTFTVIVAHQKKP